MKVSNTMISIGGSGGWLLADGLNHFIEHVG